MPSRRLLTRDVAFGPDATEAMVMAYDHLCIALHLVDRNDPMKETIAKKIIEHARHGERDAVTLAHLVLKDFPLGSA